MGFFYRASVAFDVTVPCEPFVITVATDVPIILHWLELGQSSDLGDSQEEVLNVYLKRGATPGTINGSSGAVALHDRAPAAATVIESAQSSVGSGGNIIEIIPWNIRKAGPVWIPLPGDRPTISAADNKTIFQISTAVQDSVTLRECTICWEEL